MTKLTKSVPLLLWLWGCGRVWYDPLALDDAGRAPDTGGLDATIADGTSDTGPPDAPSGDAGRSCSWFAGVPPLTVPEVVEAVRSTSLEVDAFLDPVDWTTLYFGSDRTGNAEVYLARRPTIDQPFATMALFAAANSVASDTGFSMTADGREAFLASDRDGPNVIYRATRESVSMPFGPFEEIPELAAFAPAYDPMPMLDGTTLYLTLVNALGSATGPDIAAATRTSRLSSFTAPVAAMDLSTPQSDANASFTANGKVVLFASARPGGSGDLDVWYATRPLPTEPFGTAAPVVPLNGTMLDNQPYIRPDGCEIFYSSGGDIYTARVAP